MNGKKQLIISTFIIILLANVALGFAGMGGNTTTIPQDTIEKPWDLKNATESDQDIIMAQHLIEYDAVQLQSENKLFIRETLIFRNMGTKDFSGSLRTWLPDGSEKIKVGKSEMMTGGGLIPLDFDKNGNIISWKEYVEQNSNLPSLYVVEYIVAMEPRTSSITGTYSKKLAYPTLINYRYIEKSGLPALVVKITKPQESSIKLFDENRNKINPDETGDIFRFSSPQFKELNIDLSSIDITSTSTPNSQLEQSGGTRISKIIAYPKDYINNNIKITGKVTDFVIVQTPPSYTTYMNIDDGTGSLWVATQADNPLNIQNGMELTASGFLTVNFKSSSIGKTYDLIIFSNTDKIIFPTSPIQTSNQIQTNNQIKEIQERLNQTEARQNQQETRISWLESSVNSILGWIESFF
jgi:hypothetical protein